MSLFGTGRRESVLAVLLLLALLLIQHAPGLFFGNYRRQLQPADAGVTTVVDPGHEGTWNETVLVPAITAAWTRATHGELPTWNPDARFGEPFTASGAPLLWAPYWLLALDVDWALDLVVLLHAALACVTMFRFLRALTLSRYVAFLGSGTWSMGLFLTAALDRLPEAAAAALLPFALEQTWGCLMKRHRSIHGALLGPALALPFLTGGTTTAWLGIWLCAGAAIAAYTSIDKHDRRSAYGNLSLGAAIAALVTAPVWLDRIQLGPELAPHDLDRHLQPLGLLGILTPNAFGDLTGRGPSVLRDVNPGADPLELVLYPGAMVLFLALLGLFRPKRTYLGLFWLLVAGAGLLLSLDNPLSDAFLELCGWYPDRAGATLVLWQLACVVLAALGLENFLDAPLARRFATPLAAGIAFVSALAIVAVGFVWTAPAFDAIEWLTASTVSTESLEALRWTAVRAVWPAATTALIAILFLAWRRLGVLRFKPLLGAVVLVEALTLGAMATPRGPTPLRPPEVAQVVPDLGRTVSVGIAAVPSPSWLSQHGIATVDTAGPAVLQRTADYLALIDPAMVKPGARAHIDPLVVPGLLAHPLLTAAAVDVGVAGRPFHVDGFEPATAIPLVETAPNVGSTKRARPWVVSRSVPSTRARVVFAAEAFRADRTTADVGRRTAELATLLDTTVVLESPPASFTCRKPSREPELTFDLDTPTLQRFTVDVADGAGYLVVADAFAPGWTATVDGEPTDLLAANLAFRAVPVRAGRHVVEFRYRPWSARLGLPISAAGGFLALALAILAFALRRRR